MPDSSIGVYDSSAVSQNVDVRTNAGGDMRQVVVIGDQTANDSVADVRGADPASNAEGMVVRDPNSTAIVSGLNSVRVRDIVTGTISTVGAVTGITNTVGVYFDRGDPGVKITSGAVTSITNTVAVYFDRGKPAVLADNSSTAQIFTVSGSTSGVSVSGVTLVAPSAAYSFKVFAFSLQTTGIVSQVMYFGNGSGASQTEFWRPLITASSSTSAPIGANLAVTPPGYLFATGTSTTLVLVKDTASLVHYSVSYIKESA